jgi:maltooligosyltrehalose trehalohydrolase
MAHEPARTPGPFELGARPTAGGVRFTLIAPGARAVEVLIEPIAASDPGARAALEPAGDGIWTGEVAGVGPGTRYRFRLDEGPSWPDPASRFQPEGVHGPSEVIDPDTFPWRDGGWTGLAPDELVVYELHVGTFTREGTFAAAAERLPWLRDLGVTAVELMPVADFPGARNWGYDGVSLFAPARCYGRPDELRALVDRAHALGLAVHLDVVYNHLGPDGAYLAAYLPATFSSRHESPWGRGLNFDERGSRALRRVFMENAVRWVTEYHLDGLRFDATHAIVDESATYFVAEAAAAVRRACPGRRLQLTAEDHRNLAAIARPAAMGGWGLDSVWADDFHHQVRRLLAGDADGYYADFTGTVDDLARTIRQGWFFCGQHSGCLGHARGTAPDELPYPSFVVAIQNHDQIGNRALGERLHHRIDAAAYRAASLLLLLVPETPLLFMGQEWAASTPFLYFTDHEPELGRLVTEGRRNAFGRFAAFSRLEGRAAIPDPQAAATFERSRLDWDEAAAAPHRRVAALYRAGLALRRRWCPGRARRAEVDVRAAGTGGLVLAYRHLAAGPVALAVDVEGGCRVDVAGPADGAPGEWQVALSTESADLAANPRPPAIASDGAGVRIAFERPGAVAVEWRAKEAS